MIVLDANILIRAILGRQVLQLLEKYGVQGVRFFAPDVAFADAAKHLPVLLMRHGKLNAEVTPSLDYLRCLIEPIPRDLYADFEDVARQRLRGRDEDDWPVLASALALSCPLWTEDADFFGTGVPAWTSSRVEIFLRAQVPRE